MKYIFGNWKMYLNHDESVEFAEKIKDIKPKADTEIAVFPSALALNSVKQVLEGNEMFLGAQNCAWTPKGAYTGGISALMFKEIGCKYVLVGHSERRHVFGESDVDVRKKIEAALDVGLVPVLCVGEKKEERENGQADAVVKKQLMSALEDLYVNKDSLIVAYEPVWAIGTGNSCNPEDVVSMNNCIKDELKRYTNDEIAVLYGGSVNPDNVVSYTSIETVGGVLIGGSSVKEDKFLPLIEAIK
jgi:triosephosphate isomerase